MKRIFILVLTAVLLFCVIYVGISIIDGKESVVTKVEPTATVYGPLPVTTNNSKVPLVRISLDEWIGWKSLIDANEGLITSPSSINAGKGLNIEYVIINDPNASAMNLINSTLAGAGYTVNRYAFLQDRFNNAGVKVIMPFITNYSNGGDGIIARSNISSVKDLVGKRIAVPRFSEAHTLVEWLLQNSSLTKEEQSEIRSSMVFTETSDAAAEAFFSGSVDAAATWEPYLTKASTSTNAHILFDTSMATNLILDGIVFRQDFLDKNKDFVTKLIDGALEAAAMYKTNFQNIRSISGFEFMLDDDIIAMADGANLATFADNQSLLNSVAISVYEDMANIWIDLGEIAHPRKSGDAFTAEYLIPLANKYPVTYSFDSSMFNTTSKNVVLQSSNKEALLSMSLDIKFETDSYKIGEESYKTLNQFANIAKILNGVYIQIEGNTAPVAGDDGVDFSYKRALSIAKYLQLLGIDAKRIIVVGNGDKNPMTSNDTEQGRAQNRRTEVFFKQIVGY